MYMHIDSFFLARRSNERTATTILALGACVRIFGKRRMVSGRNYRKA